MNLPSLPFLSSKISPRLVVGSVGILLAGGVVGYFLPHPQLTPVAPQSQQDFFGVVAERDGGRLLVQQIFGTKSFGATLFRVDLDSTAQYFHQKPGENGAFAREAGKVDDIKKGMYVYISSKDSLINPRQIRPVQLIYSEKSPFLR